VFVPELPELLTPDERQIHIRYHEHTDGALGAHDVLTTRILATRQQHDVSLRNLLNDLKHDNHERNYYKLILAAIIFTIIL
jgi:hypothetical protein